MGVALLCYGTGGRCACHGMYSFKSRLVLTHLRGRFILAPLPGEGWAGDIINTHGGFRNLPFLGVANVANFG